MNNAFDQFNTPEFNTAPQKKSLGFAITSLVLGIVAVCICCACCGITYILTGILGVAAIVFAIVSKARTGKMHGMAIAGLILGIFAVVLFLIMLGLVIWVSSLTATELETIFRDFLQDDELYELYMQEFANAGMSETGDATPQT